MKYKSARSPNPPEKRGNRRLKVTAAACPAPAAIPAGWMSGIGGCCWGGRFNSLHSKRGLEKCLENVVCLPGLGRICPVQLLLGDMEQLNVNFLGFSNVLMAGLTGKC